jgi:serine/threonine protein phosphatase 1
MKRFTNFWRDENAHRAAPVIPGGIRVYAVGDIHGHRELLERLLALIEKDISGRARLRNVLIFVGDLIDRGPESNQVVERLRTLKMPDVRTVFLMGNHEEILLRIIDGEDSLVWDWLSFGGDTCMTSYGLDPKALKGLSIELAADAIRAAIPNNHVEFLRSFADSFAVGDYLFVHAGIRPGIPIAQQRPEDLRWIRGPFLGWKEDHEVMVVHGHTISATVDEQPNRIGIDTSAYQNGLLTAMGAEGAKRWYIQAGSQNA